MKTKIMIVDDEPDLREFVKTVLEIDGYEVSEAADSATLRRALNGAAPAAVILDLNLPDGSGLALLPELKQKWPAAKIIILTGYGTVEVAEEVYKLDSGLYLQSKPFDGEMLKALLEMALKGESAPR